jgi:hypothetical protein
MLPVLRRRRNRSVPARLPLRTGTFRRRSSPGPRPLRTVPALRVRYHRSSMLLRRDTGADGPEDPPPRRLGPASAGSEHARGNDSDGSADAIWDGGGAPAGALRPRRPRYGRVDSRGGPTDDAIRVAAPLRDAVVDLDVDERAAVPALVAGRAVECILGKQHPRSRDVHTRGRRLVVRPGGRPRQGARCVPRDYRSRRPPLLRSARSGRQG